MEKVKKGEEIGPAPPTGLEPVWDSPPLVDVEAFQERAVVRELEGGLPRTEAEKEALCELLAARVREVLEVFPGVRVVAQRAGPDPREDFEGFVRPRELISLETLAQRICLGASGPEPLARAERAAAWAVAAGLGEHVKLAGIYRRPVRAEAGRRP